MTEYRYRMFCLTATDVVRGIQGIGVEPRVTFPEDVRVIRVGCWSPHGPTTTGDIVYVVLEHPSFPPLCENELLFPDGVYTWQTHTAEDTP